MDGEGNSELSAREYDALRDEDVTPLPASKPHVVFRLRREEDEIAPWFVELVFLLFNAQGDVLQVVRGFKPPENPKGSQRSTDSSSGVTYFGEANFRVTRPKSKEAEEREVVRFSVAKLHPFVEVMGCLVTYAEDEIARSPQLNAFSLTCDLHAVDTAQAEDEAQALAAGGKRFVFNPGERTRLAEVFHDPKTLRKNNSKQPNVLVLCKIFRRHGDHHDWAFHAATDERSSVVVRSAVTASLVEAMQVFLLDLMPDIKIPNRNPLSSVSGICAALSCNEFLGIERHFPEDGLPKPDFARLLLFELMQTRPRLQQHLGRATALVGTLFEMFEQIDINGDAVVDWEEFTSFCVALGLIATRVHHDENDHDQAQSNVDSHDAPPRSMVMYRQEPLSTTTASRTFPYQVSKLKAFQQLKRLAVIEHKSSRILIFDLDMSFLHELNCSEKLAAEKKAGDKHQDVLETLEVLDAEHVPSRNALVVASNDLCISLWSIIDATVGSYVFNGKLVGRFPALFVKWCPAPLKRLLVAGGSTEQVHLWDLETPMHSGAAPPPPPMILPRHHNERLAACLDLSETPYVATASFDHSITIWETVAGTNSSLGGHSAVLTVSFVLRGHQQAVLTLDYAHTLLLSSGFEYQAYCWGIPGRSLKTKLGGHHHCLMGAKFVSTSLTGPCLVVTGDQSGHFKLWDITRCAKGLTGNHLSVMLQTFELHTPNLCRFRMFMVASSGGGMNPSSGVDKQKEPHDDPTAHSNLESPAYDIITGNLRLYRFSAVTQAVASAQEDGNDDTPGVSPTCHVIYNTVANTFVGVVENRITVWSGNSGAKIEEPVVVRDADVCAIVFDSPRERKLFVATSDGAIRLYNPVTGALLFKMVVHEGTITSLVFCSYANCLVSTGDDRSVCVLDSPPGEAELEILHSMEKAHNSSITCCCCSPPPSPSDAQTTRFVATADTSGGVNVYDLRRLTLLFRCVGGHEREVRAIHFPATSPRLLVSGDIVSNVFIWPTAGVRGNTASPLMRLMLQSSLPPRPVPIKSLPNKSTPKADADGVTSICSTSISQNSQSSTHSPMVYISSESGQIFAWALYSLADKTRKERHSTRHSDLRRHRSVLTGSNTNLISDIDVGQEATSVAARRHGVLAAHSKSFVINDKAFEVEDHNVAAQVVVAADAAALKSVEKTSTLPVIPPTRTWMAHTFGVQSVHYVPWPGELLSLGYDGVVKIWDHTATCVGHIATTGEQTSAAASAWKLVRRDHASGSDEKGLFERIACEVIAKHQRRLKREQGRQHKARHKQQHLQQGALDSSNATPSSLTSSLELELRSKKVTESNLAPIALFPDASLAMTSAANALLAQLPFSATSVNSGLYQGLFGPEEAQQLRSLAISSSGLMAEFADKRKRIATLVPLFSTPEEMARARAKAKAKARATVNKGQESAELPSVGTRLLANYPLELERRAAANAASSGASLHSLDVEPSPFLREKLQDAASPLRKAVKSTPKKRLNRSPAEPAGVDIKMNASVVILARNVSLPKLTQSMSGREPDELLHYSEALSSSVSTPTLPQAIFLAQPAPSPSLDRSNIERKLRLCEKIVASVCLMTSHTKVLKEQQTEAPPSPSSPGSKTRRTLSSTPSMLVPGKNPFGPHYTVKQVEQLAVELARLDEDGSGDLDQREWTKLVQFCGLAGSDAKNAAMSIETLFHSLDRDSSGAISIRELLPTLFARATPDQIQQMRALVQTRMKMVRGHPIARASVSSSVAETFTNESS